MPECIHLRVRTMAKSDKQVGARRHSWLLIFFIMVKDLPETSTQIHIFDLHAL